MKQNQPFKTFPPQHQGMQPGIETDMSPAPVYEHPNYKPSGKLSGKTALITGGDSGIGRAVSILYAKEGANVAFVYLNEDEDASKTLDDIVALGRQCLSIKADLKEQRASFDVVKRVVDEYGKIDILVNNAAVQYPQNSILDISREQMIHTFESNFFSYFYMTKAALSHIPKNGSIINTASVTAFEGNPALIDYSSTKGSIVSFTRSMSLSLVEQGIRVNAVAPGPVWTPLIVSSFSPEDVETFGSTTPMQRAAQPYELAPIYVFLASDDASNITGQVFNVNSGTIVS
jgi:NAD(P)-dependent dehydrogenase (short-subunit alcohol dehydrogenase family)